MANTASRVASAIAEWGDDTIKRQPTNVVQKFYPGAMIALDGSGNAVKCDNTTGIRFDGLLADSDGVNILTTGSDEQADAAKQLTVERPFRFQMAIAAAVAGDEGRKVYAKFDNEVSYSTSNSILVGTVDKVINATTVLIAPAYTTASPAALSGNTITFAGSTGVDQLIIPDNLADALSVAEGSNLYLTFKTTDGSETVLVKKLLDVVAGINFSGATTANVVKMPDNLADALNIKEGTNSYLKFVTTDSSESIVLGKAATGVSLAVTGALTSSGPTGGGIGYATGAGGAVSQATDRTTGVTVNTLTGAITTQATSLAAGASVQFTVTNSTVAVGDTVICSVRSGPTTTSTTAQVVTVANGSFKILLVNSHASTADTGAAIINYAVVKAVSS